MKKNVPPSVNGGAQKKSNTAKQQVVVDDKKIKIRYNYMDHILFHKFFLIVEKFFCNWPFVRSKFVDEKHSIKEYKYLFNSDNFSFYIRTMKIWHTYHKVVLMFREHHRNFENIKSQLLQQYGSFDKQTNQFVLMEPENVKNFQIEYKKLKSTIVQIDMDKFSPQLFLFDMEEIFKTFTNNLHHFSTGPTFDDNPWLILSFYEMFSDIFDASEIDTWNYKEEMEEDWNNNFGITS